MKRRTLMVSSVLLFAACSKHSAAGEAQAAAAPSATVRQAQASSAPVQHAPGHLLEAGDQAPDFSVIAHTGSRVKLSQYRGSHVVIYFYPKDQSPGCTIEADAFRDRWQALRASHAIVLGVSADDNVSHRAFASTEGLPFLLLPDPKHRIAGEFGVPVQHGREKRVTFIIDKSGKIAKVFPNVNPKDHVAQVLAALKALG